MAYETEVDRMLADPRRRALMDEFETRARAQRPVRWHRLIHRVLGDQMHASVDLASVTECKWRLARAGIETDIVSEWITF